MPALALGYYSTGVSSIMATRTYVVGTRTGLVQLALPRTKAAVQLEEVIEQMRVECILDATNEDHVQDCMRAYDHALESAAEVEEEEAVADKYDEVLTPLEECIIQATSEDEVGACVQKMDEEEVLTPLEECIIQADGEDQVGDCFQRLDDDGFD